MVTLRQLVEDWIKSIGWPNKVYLEGNAIKINYRDMRLELAQISDDDVTVYINGTKYAATASTKSIKAADPKFLSKLKRYLLQRIEHSPVIYDYAVNNYGWY